jgi:hypothetical protein
VAEKRNSISIGSIARVIGAVLRRDVWFPPPDRWMMTMSAAVLIRPTTLVSTGQDVPATKESAPR